MIELCSEFVSQSLAFAASLYSTALLILFDSELFLSIFDVFLYFGISSQAEVCSWVVQQQYISQVQLLQSVLPHPNQWCQVNNFYYIIYLVNYSRKC